VATSGCASGSHATGAARLLREGEDVLAGMDDLETARIATVARLERLEELVRVEPGSPAVRRMLVVGWARYGMLFVEDDLEEARERADAPSTGYHAVRARNAYERAIHHGREYLGGASFDAAVGADGVAAYLAARPGDDPELLVWMGAAWIGRARVGLEDRRALALQAHVGEALLERSLALLSGPQGSPEPPAAPPPAGAGAGAAPSEPGAPLRAGAPAAWAHSLLGLWWGRPGGDLERARQQFERAAEASGRRLLLTQVLLARTVVCQAHERERWDALFKEVLDARDPAPELRIDNAVAKRKAARDVQGTRRAQCVP
jgi:hypothetical protein